MTEVRWACCYRPCPETWAENYLLFKPAEDSADFIFNLHRAGHVWPFGASDMIMRFFRQHHIACQVTSLRFRLIGI
jgi:hypothetical protein